MRGWVTTDVAAVIQEQNGCPEAPGFAAVAVLLD
jgi:hypothetical protein